MKLTLGKLFFILVVLGSLIFQLRPIGDPDFWWHLKTGQLIVQNHQIPAVDDFSFTANGKPWIAHEWLSEIILYGVYKAGGIPLSILFSAIIVTAAFLLTLLRSNEKKNIYALASALLLGVILSTPVLWARPQNFTLLYASLFLIVLDRFEKHGNTRLLILLPVIMLLWVNQHGAYIIGLGLIGIYILGNFIDRAVLVVRKQLEFKSIISKSLWILAIFFGICLLAVLANPNGVKMILYPFQTVGDDSMKAYNQEWVSPNFHERTWIPLAVMILALIWFAMKSKKPISTTNSLLCVVFAFLALFAVKQVALFAIAAIPILADLISDVIPFSESPGNLKKGVVPLAILSIAGIVFLGANSLIHINDKQSEFMDGFFPSGAMAFIQEEGIAGNIFNSYNWGGYIIWNRYPQQRVYIDGRCDLYGESFVNRYVDIYMGKPGWNKALKEDKIAYVLVEPSTYLAYALKDSSEWTQIYSDEVSVLYEFTP